MIPAKVLLRNFNRQRCKINISLKRNKQRILTGSLTRHCMLGISRFCDESEANPDRIHGPLSRIRVIYIWYVSRSHQIAVENLPSLNPTNMLRFLVETERELFQLTPRGGIIDLLGCGAPNPPQCIHSWLYLIIVL